VSAADDERSATELRHLAAAMAHEVRNPLNSMAIHVELMESRLRKEGVAPEILKSLGVLAQEIDRVDKILEQYLNYAGPAEAARAPVAVATLLGQALDGLRPEAQERGVALELAAEGVGRWPVDAAALAQAVTAVAKNAIAVSPRGAAVRVTARNDGEEQGEIAICDGAEPVADADLAKLFHMGSKRNLGGIGLTVAKQIVKGHGGSLVVKRGDGGNVITLRLPLDLDFDEEE
jgi:signal transduction histidine kinase